MSKKVKMTPIYDKWMKQQFVPDTSGRPYPGKVPITTTYADGRVEESTLDEEFGDKKPKDKH